MAYDSTNSERYFGIYTYSAGSIDAYSYLNSTFFLAEGISGYGELTYQSFNNDVDVYSLGILGAGYYSVDVDINNWDFSDVGFGGVRYFQVLDSFGSIVGTSYLTTSDIEFIVSTADTYYIKIVGNYYDDQQYSVVYNFEGLLNSEAVWGTSASYTGLLRSGQTIGASVSYSDADGNSDGIVYTRWYVDGEYKGSSETFTLTDAYVGKTITFQFAFYDDTGNLETSPLYTAGTANYGSTLNRSVTTSLPEIAHVLNLTLQGASNINGYGNSNANTLRGNSGNNILDGKSGNDTLYGGNNNDKLYGGSGNDRSYGEAGNDSLYMDAGNDTLDGGSGTDWLYVTGSTNSVVNLAKTTGQNTGYGTDIIKNIENASGGSGVDKFYGTSGNNTLKGNNGNDLLYGQNGNDTLYGGNNNDKLYGGSGNDRSYGEAGNDSLYMDAGNDTLDGGSGTDWLYVTGSTNSVVNLAKTTGQNTGYGTDIIKNIENASGGSGVDKFYGTSGNNTLKGNNGNDLLYGQNGNDTLYGGNNNDKLYGGSGNDTLSGDAGRDILQGDAGKDTLYGGADADTFVFRKTSDSSASASSADIIRDFTRGSDKIDLHYIDASTKLSGNNAFTFDGTKSFGTSNEGDIYYKQFNNAGTSNDYTMVYIDTDNDTGTEMSIKLMGLHALTASDFIL